MMESVADRGARLNWTEKSAYGAAQFSEAVCGFGVNLFLALFYTTVIHVDPARVGLVWAGLLLLCLLVFLLYPITRLSRRKRS